ncbi:hypothetical protein DQ04_05101030 [Trypanosoma grayi]|uniref:hypothetical protein n=1 Tax=Trypanosoma grayi TaxID=71804 RepID=UPI0004F47A49|nr:hypothetical protein DQ04_05101030 [Trypanosoma grayi]KEG09511.1 hypothetical protein DQ04_05101030 [Trypanosoma grayi]
MPFDSEANAATYGVLEGTEMTTITFTGVLSREIFCREVFFHFWARSSRNFAGSAGSPNPVKWDGIPFSIPGDIAFV